MVIGEINSVLSIGDRLIKWYRSWRKRTNPSIESVAARYVRMLESHGVHRNQISRFIGSSLTLKDVENDAALLAKLDEEIVESTCKRFAIRREWLDGAEPQAHPDHDFYKYPEKFRSFVDDLLEKNPDGDMHGVLIVPDERDGHMPAILILQETIGHVGEKPIMRYHLCNNWSFTYWKSRAYLTACVAIAWKRRIYVHGTKVSTEMIEQLASGKTLFGWQGEGIWDLGHATWHPEDMTLHPQAFLDGINPEQDNFGIKSSLELWLRLEEEGFMDSGLEVNARLDFEQELAKYRPL